MRGGIAKVVQARRPSHGLRRAARWFRCRTWSTRWSRADSLSSSLWSHRPGVSSCSAISMRVRATAQNAPSTTPSSMPSEPRFRTRSAGCASRRWSSPAPAAAVAPVEAERQPSSRRRARARWLPRSSRISRTRWGCCRCSCSATAVRASSSSTRPTTLERPATAPPATSGTATSSPSSMRWSR